MISQTKLTDEQVAYQRELERVTESPLVALLESGEWAAVRPFIYTFGLLVGLDVWQYRTRFCYPRLDLALHALLTWDGSGDPPGSWLKEKGSGAARLNPHVCNCQFGRGLCAQHKQGES